MKNNKTWFMILKGIEPEYGAINLQMETFDDSLEALQKLVDGSIEHYVIDEDLNDNYIDMWINEEGKFRDDFKPMFGLFYDGKPYDVIVGPCVFTMYDREGNTHGLTDDAMRRVREFLYRCPMVELVTSDGKKFPCLRVDK